MGKDRREAERLLKSGWEGMVVWIVMVGLEGRDGFKQCLGGRAGRTQRMRRWGDKNV